MTTQWNPSIYTLAGLLPLRNQRQLRVLLTNGRVIVVHEAGESETSFTLDHLELDRLLGMLTEARAKIAAARRAKGARQE